MYPIESQHLGSDRSCVRVSLVLRWKTGQKLVSFHMRGLRNVRGGAQFSVEHRSCAVNSTETTVFHNRIKLDAHVIPNTKINPRWSKSLR